MLDEMEAGKLGKNLEKLMLDDEVFLKQDLSLPLLAEMIGGTTKNTSLLLNNHLDTNFYDYVNKYRIQKFMTEFEKEENKSLTTIGLAENCGFTSKSSFYRAFKKETRMTPSEYKKSKS